MPNNLLIKNATLANGAVEDVGIEDGKISPASSLSTSLSKSQIIDASGLYLLPGCIDTQVHFRQPGFTHKETIKDGSRAALTGGVTTYFEMPNTNPATTDEATLAQKVAIAAKDSFANYGFFVGATAANAPHLKRLERLEGAAGVKIFVGSSTGDLLVEQTQTLKQIFSHCSRRVAVHSEDEATLRQNRHKPTHLERRPIEAAVTSTKRLIALTQEANRHPLHILHISSAEELPLIADAPWVSCEATPQHLTLYAPDCYQQLGTKAQMNPPIRSKRHQEALWDAIEKGIVKTIGSDHAPHTLEEKQGKNPPSGIPGVATLLPLMLNHVATGRLSLNKLVELTAQNPAKLFGVQNKGAITNGFDGDLVLVDMKAKYFLEPEYKCGWSPFAGTKLQGKIRKVILNGKVVLTDGELTTTPLGKIVSFSP